MKTRWASRAFRDLPGDCALWDRQPSVEALWAKYQVGPGEIVVLRERMTLSIFRSADLWPERPESDNPSNLEAQAAADPPAGRPLVYVCEVLPDI